MASHIVNIGIQNSHDQFYRYKMPSMTIKIEGSGNGVKTKITNISDVAKSLSRSQSDIMKFFGYELGTMAKGDIINGLFNSEILNDILERYISTYVTCATCGNPETLLSVKKEQLRSKCKACGSTYFIQNNNKLTCHIIKKSMK